MLLERTSITAQNQVICYPVCQEQLELTPTLPFLY